MIRLSLAAIFLVGTHLARRKSKTWIHPSALAMLVLSIATVGSLALTDFWIEVHAAMLLLAGAATFATAATATAARLRPARPRPTIHREWVRGFVLVGIVAALSAALLTVAGIIPGGGSRIEQVIAVGSDISARRYAGEPAHPLLGPLLGLYFLGSFAAALLMRGNWRDRLMAAVAPAAVLPLSVVSTGRAALVFGAAFWLSTYLAMRVNDGRLRFRIGRTLAVTGATVAVGSLIWITLSLIRYGGLSVAAVNRTASGFLIYSFGEVPGFSSWLEHRLPGEFGGGQYTFQGLTSLVAPLRLGQGLYAEGYPIDDIGRSTNVFTSYRGLIEDFGIGGMFVFVVLAGATAGWLFRSAGRSPRHAVLLSPVYAFVLLQWIVSPYAYTGAALAAVIFAGFQFVPVATRPILPRRPRASGGVREVAAATDIRVRSPA